MDKELWQKLQPLMDEALALSVDDRRPWLERIRLESPTIVNELEALLAREGTLDRRGFLDTPLTLGRDVVAALTGEAPADRLPRLREALAGRYTIEGLVGQGGMAEVYGAQDERHGRRVAVKVIRSDASSVLGAERFLAEIRLTAKLTHPNILPLLDSGEVDGVLYYVMPFIEGESLRVRMRREGALPVADTVRLVRAVAEALAYAHEQGTVHRDIKPDNVLLSGRQAWVADFGIARAIASSATSHHSATSVGVALGSPGYMAPEQIEGAEGVDARADLYSLGVMAWEMLAGRPLFEGTTMQQLFLQHLTVTAPRIERVRPEGPAALADVIARLLAKSPDDRPTSAAALLNDLEGLASVSGVHPPASRPASRRLMIGVALAVAAGLAAWATRGELAIATESLTTTGDLGAAILSPDGRRIAYRRQVNPAAVWIRDVTDSASARVLVQRMPAGAWGWVDDSTIVSMRRDTVSLVHAVSGVVTTPSWPGSTRLTLLGPGLAYAIQGRPTGPGRVTYRRILAGGWGDSLGVALDSGETVVRLLRHPSREDFVMLATRADSTVGVHRVGRDGERRVLRMVPALDTTGLRRALGTPAGVPFLSPAGDHLYGRQALDSLVRIDLGSPDGEVERLALPPGSLGPPSRDGLVLLRTNEHGGRTWRFPIGDDMELRGAVIDQVSGSIHMTALDPSGKLIAQVEGLPGQANSIAVRSLETGVTRRVYTTDRAIVVMHWSPDGTRLAIRTFAAGESQRLAVLDVRDGGLITLGRPPIRPGSGHVDAGFPPVWSIDSKTVFAQDFSHHFGPDQREYSGVIPFPVVRRYALVEGDTGVALHAPLVSHYPWLPRGALDTLWINGMVVSPDGASLALGGSSITVIPLAGRAPPRRVVDVDTTITWMYPLAWRPDGRIAYATRSSRVGEVGNVFRTFSVSATGGPSQASGAMPPACTNINVLESRMEASCFESQVRADLLLLRGLR